MEAPFGVGDRISADHLIDWEYRGLSGKPGQEGARRRFVKGQWVLEVRAMANPKARTRVTSIRTQDADEIHWQETRERRMRYKRRSL